MYTQLDFLADTIIIEALAKEPGYKVAQDSSSVIASVATKVKEYVLSNYHKDQPLASALAFIAPGILGSLGFWWTAVLYEVAEALGFDWIKFWTAVKDDIGVFVSTIAKGEKPSEQDIASHVSGVVSSALQNSSTGEPNQGMLENLAGKIKLFSVKDALELKKFAIKNDPSLLKTAGVMTIFKGKLIRFFIKTIGWAITVGLISLGFAAAGGAISALLGLHKGSDSASTTPGTEGSSTELEPVQQLEMSPSIPQELYRFHRNDMSSIWIENGDIGELKEILLGWIKSAFPQLEGIENSDSLNKMVVLFSSRNRMAAGTDMITVPMPYQRKIDIVSQVVNGFLKEHPEQTKQPTKPAPSGQTLAYR